jgi:hypothetical protein
MHSVKTAAESDIAEVMVCMFGPTSDTYGLLHRGTRVRKMHSSYRSTFRTIGDIPIAMVSREKITPLRQDYKRRRNDRSVIINPAFEEALIGMAPGETRTIVLPAEKAYGPYRKKLVFRLKRRDLNLPEEPVPGGTARISLKNGRSSLVTVLKADAKTVTVDANHPLAGKDLTFSITLLGIRKGSDE